jgi:hypothetical protein
MKRGKKNERRKKGKIIIWENGGAHQGQDGNFQRDEEPKERTRERRERSEDGRRENFLAYKRRGP